ncbi:MAG: response regulator, partial [Bdellovibrionales bacterium]|nr:response regulator [Bdellovibrionales bacterium]
MKRNILLVEGDPKVLKLTRFMLEQAGYVVKSVSDGYAALDALRTFDFDLALLDIHLPRMSGVRLLREFQNLQERTAPPVLLLANENQQEDVKRAMQAGAWDFIMKPPQRELLLRRVEALLGTRPQFEELFFPETAPQSEGELQMPLKVKSISVKGLVIHSPIPLQESNQAQLVFELKVLRDLNIDPSKLRICDCCQIEDGWEVYVTFLDLDSKDYQAIRE